MSDELKNLKFYGGKKELLYFICDVVGKKGATVSDAEITCRHASGMHYLSVLDLIMYCGAFGWVEQSGNLLSVSESVRSNLGNEENLNNFLIKSTIEKLFKSEVFNIEMFHYDVSTQNYTLKKEMFSLQYSTIINVLTSQGFLVALRKGMITSLSIFPSYNPIIAKFCKTARQKLSLEQLKKRIENNDIIGEKAELFVLDYEKKRLGVPLGNQVNRISEIDVSAGYDIVSFNSPSSDEPDRFIEVKAVSIEGFYWSANEYATAKLLGEKYFIYLVSLSKTDDSTYEPEIINNPAKTIMEGINWIVEPQSYKVFRTLSSIK